MKQVFQNFAETAIEDYRSANLTDSQRRIALTLVKNEMARVSRIRVASVSSRKAQELYSRYQNLSQMLGDLA